MATDRPNGIQRDLGWVPSLPVRGPSLDYNLIAPLLESAVQSVAAPIVLIHGLFGHLQDSRILDGFGGREVHAPDLVGYGSLREEDTSSLTLDDQANRIARYVGEHDLERVNLVGHSVGGAVAILVASSFPEIVATLTSVEGNFTLEDAFSSAHLAMKPDEEVEEIIGEYRNDPDAWFAGAGVPINEWTQGLAVSWLNNQPPSTSDLPAILVWARPS